MSTGCSAWLVPSIHRNAPISRYGVGRRRCGDPDSNGDLMTGNGFASDSRAGGRGRDDDARRAAGAPEHESVGRARSGTPSSRGQQHHPRRSARPRARCVVTRRGATSGPVLGAAEPSAQRRGARGHVPRGIRREAYSWGGMVRTIPIVPAGARRGCRRRWPPRLGADAAVPLGNAAQWTRRLTQADDRPGRQVWTAIARAHPPVRLRADPAVHDDSGHAGPGHRCGSSAARDCSMPGLWQWGWGSGQHRSAPPCCARRWPPLALWVLSSMSRLRSRRLAGRVLRRRLAAHAARRRRRRANGAAEPGRAAPEVRERGADPTAAHLLVEPDHAATSRAHIWRARSR